MTEFLRQNDSALRKIGLFPKQVDEKKSENISVMDFPADFLS